MRSILQDARGGFIRATWVGWAIGALAVWLGVVFGMWIAEGNLGPIRLIVGGAVVAALRLALSDVALLSLGVCADLWLPIPLIGFFPPVFLVVAALLACHLARRMVRRDLSFSPVWTVNVWVGLLFLWVFVRWVMDPAIPRAVSGDVGDVSGFRSFFNYMNCFVICVSMGVLVRSSEGMVTFLRWLGWVSVGFCCLYLGATFWPTPAVYSWLLRFGVMPVSGEVGFLRYVALPSYGLTLITIALLPRVGCGGFRVRTFFILLGAVSIVVGGNRGTIVQSVIAVGIMLLLTKRIKAVLAMAVMAAVLAGVGYHYGETAELDAGGRVTRLAGLVSPRAAHVSDGWSNIEWRLIRWKRAIADITARPLVGHGFEGIEDAINKFMATGVYGADMLREDLDIVTGNTHNGYISAARMLGIPASALFLVVAGGVAIRNVRMAMGRNTSATRSELAAWCAGTILGLLGALLTGLEISSYQIWVSIGLGLLLAKERQREVLAPSDSRMDAAIPVGAVPAVADGPRR